LGGSLALSATSRDLELTSEVLYGLASAPGGMANLTVRHRVTYTDIHANLACHHTRMRSIIGIIGILVNQAVVFLVRTTSRAKAG
jgi:hypothetical protein